MAIEILTKRVLILILILFYYYCFYRVRMVGGGWALKVCLHVLYWTKVVDANYRCSRSHRQGWSLRWFLSNCFRNENVLKLSKLEIYDMLIVKTKKLWGHWTRLEDLTSIIYHLFSNMAPSWPYYELQQKS